MVRLTAELADNGEGVGVSILAALVLDELETAAATTASWRRVMAVRLACAVTFWIINQPKSRVFKMFCPLQEGPTFITTSSWSPNFFTFVVAPHRSSLGSAEEKPRGLPWASWTAEEKPRGLPWASWTTELQEHTWFAKRHTPYGQKTSLHYLQGCLKNHAPIRYP